MKFLFSILLLLLPFGTFAQQTWEKMYAQADSIQRSYDFGKSIPLFESALELAEEEFGKNSEQYLMTRNGLGRSISYMWDKENIKEFLIENTALCRSYNPKSDIYAQSLHIIRTFYHPLSKGNKPDLSEKFAGFKLKMTYTNDNYYIDVPIGKSDLLAINL